jgi:hypothetical protein
MLKQVRNLLIGSADGLIPFSDRLTSNSVLLTRLRFRVRPPYIQLSLDRTWHTTIPKLSTKR